MKTFFSAIVISILCLQIPVNGYCADSLIGEWEVISQTPSQKELLAIANKPAGMPNVNPADVNIIESKEKLIITDKSITTETVGEGMSGSDEQQYKVEGDKIIYVFPEPAPTTEFYKYAKQFYPKYISFKFEGENLILTTSEISGYQNKTIKKTLRRVK